MHRSQVSDPRWATLIVIATAAVALGGCVMPGTSRSALDHIAVTPPPSTDDAVAVLPEGPPAVSLVEGGEAPPQVDSSPSLAAPRAPPVPTRNTPARKRFRWARLDGQLISGNAELTAKARADLIDCKADAPPRAAMGAGGEACMKERGYYVRAAD
jgi:hypothetical protein